MALLACPALGVEPCVLVFALQPHLQLVTRALERDIVLAHHKQVTKPGEALKELEHKHRYRMLLRSIDCVSRWVTAAAAAAGTY